MKILLNGTEINDFCLKRGDFPQAATAEKYFCEYVEKLTGRKICGNAGEVRFACDEAADAVAEEVKKLLESNPDCNIVSVSQGDNKNFCTCEKCREKTARVGLTRAYYDFINVVACKIYEYRPDVLVHTFAYMNLCDVGDEFALAPNIMIQYCTAGCVIHPIGGCEHNADQAKNLAIWSKMCNNVFIWDYINCFVSFPRVRAYKTRRHCGKRRIRSAPRKTPYRNYLLRPLS